MENRILAIDPGNMKSGWIIGRDDEEVIGGFDVVSFGVDENKYLRGQFKEAVSLFQPTLTRLVIETPKPRGMPTAGEEMETMIHIGRFIQQWSRLGGRWSYVFRQDVKLNLCGNNRAKDPNVSQAIKDRFGGEQNGRKCRVCKGKGWVGRGRPVCTACNGEMWEVPPGPLAGVATHVWAALGVALWFVDVGEVHQRIINPNQNKKKRKSKKSKKDPTA